MHYLNPLSLLGVVYWLNMFLAMNAFANTQQPLSSLWEGVIVTMISGVSSPRSWDHHRVPMSEVTLSTSANGPVEAGPCCWYMCAFICIPLLCQGYCICLYKYSRGAWEPGRDWVQKGLSSEWLRMRCVYDAGEVSVTVAFMVNCS